MSHLKVVSTYVLNVKKPSVTVMSIKAMIQLINNGVNCESGNTISLTILSEKVKSESNL